MADFKSYLGKSIPIIASGGVMGKEHYKAKIEASILIKSLRRHHEQPIYIVCDSETKKFLEKLR